MQVTMITIKPDQPVATQQLSIQPAPIVKALKETMPKIGDSLDIDTLVADTFTVSKESNRFVSDDHHYQVRVKYGNNIMEIIELPTQTQVALQFD